MAVPSSAGQGPPRSPGRPVGAYLAVRLAVPVVLLVLAWVAVAGAVLAGGLHDVVRQSGHRAIVEAVVVAGAGLLVALAVTALLWAVARRLAREAAGLATRQAGQPAGIAEFAAVTTDLERMRDAATEAAAAEARLRGGFRQVLTSLGRRNQSLLLRQLRIIDTLEQQAASPAALADLFALDHLTTRMRRHAESLTVLSGTPAARPRIGQVAVIDVIRAAVSETEDYKRVVVRTETEEAVTASAVNDMIHLLAELIENATMFSPSATKVEVRAERVANGFAIEVEDKGLGIAPDQLSDLNARLASPPDFDLVDADRLGLFVAGLLAARHRVEVSLTPSPYRGTKAIVLLPDELVLPDTDAGAFGAARLRTTNALSLVGVAASTARPDRLAEARPEPLLEALPEPEARPGDGVAATRPATTFHGLPRRLRPDKQPQPGEEERPAGPGRKAAPTDAPAPEEARQLAASLQRSWRRSRADDDPPADDDPLTMTPPTMTPVGIDPPDDDPPDDDPPGNDPPAAEPIGRPQGGWAPNSEEEA